MPIYEFYCSKCHTIFNFLSKSINTDKQPSCPKCNKKKLERQVSMFSAIDGSRENTEADESLPFDESKMESAMAALASEAESINEDDPRAAAQLMRKMSDMTGMKFNDSMEEAIARMEAGEDPEQIEQEMGALLENDDMPFSFEGKGGRRSRPPKRDETLYDL